MKNLHKKPLALTLGTTLLAGLASTGVYAETSSPFAMNELSSGYMQLAEADMAAEPSMKKTEGSCGEAKCGANKAKAGMDNAEATPKVEGEMKAAEGKCGDKKMPEATTATPMDGTMKATEGKCGDKKMPETTTAAPMDASMKAAEGKCGDKKMDSAMKKTPHKKHKSKKNAK